MLGLCSIFGIAIACVFLSIGHFLACSSYIATIVVTVIFGLLSFAVIPIKNFYRNEGTPGAGDNMICTALAMEVGKYFASLNTQSSGLQHTRVIVASWDAEEAGLRGARAYIKENITKLKNVKIYNFNLECMYDYKELSLFANDLNSLVSLSMVDDCVDISDHLGYSISRKNSLFWSGGTDAAEFAKAGIEATALARINWIDKGDDPAYHALRDTIDAVDPQAVQQSIHLCIAYG